MKEVAIGIAAVGAALMFGGAFFRETSVVVGGLAMALLALAVTFTEGRRP